MSPEGMRMPPPREAQQEKHFVGTPNWWKDQSETHLPDAPEWFHKYVATGGGLLVDALAVVGVLEGGLAVASKVKGPMGEGEAATSLFKKVNADALNLIPKPIKEGVKTAATGVKAGIVSLLTLKFLKGKGENPVTLNEDQVTQAARPGDDEHKIIFTDAQLEGTQGAGRSPVIDLTDGQVKQAAESVQQPHKVTVTDKQVIDAKKARSKKK